MDIPASSLPLTGLALAQPDTTASPAPATTGGADMMGAAPSGGTVAPGGGSPPLGQPAPRPTGLFDSSFTLIIIMVGFLVMMMWTASRRQKKEQSKRQELINSIRKGDTVLTIAGIKGTVAENPGDKDEVVLIVDESTRNRIRFMKSAITQVLTSREAPTSEGAIEAKASEPQPASA